MAHRDEQQQMYDPVFYGKAVRLISGRVALIFLLLMANLWRTSGFADLTAGDSPDALLIVFSFTVGLSVIYFVALRLAPAALWQVRIQFVFDLIIITWLVMQTGDIISPYATLYIVLISVAGFFLGKTETLLMAIACAVSFTALSVLAANGIVIATSGDQPGSRILQIVGVNDVAILLVGLIAGRLSERRMLSEELKHSEASFADLHLLHERIVESINSGLITTDLSGRIYSFNHAAETITGIPPEGAVGKSVFELFGPEVRTVFDRCLSQNGKADTSDLHFETSFGDPGSDKHVRAVCTLIPLISTAGATTGMIVNVQDVTQLKVLEESVRRSDRLAAVGRMAAGLAHEIRNPLGSMSSALQFLQERASGAADEKALMNVVLRESDRLNTIITNFLSFARPTVNGSGSSRSILNVCTVINDCTALIKHSPEATSEHQFEIRADGELYVAGDESQLKQVFWNLARNAIQSMPDGGTLAIDATEENGIVRIEFSDTGVGIDRSMLDHIFEPFLSGSGGTGLGLSIVHKIVQDHDGRIEVDSRVGKGTRFTVEFPSASNKN